MNRFRPHRIARLHYLPRTVAFAVTWLASLALYSRGVLGVGHLIYGALVLLAYPQLVHVYAGLARDPKGAVLRNLTLDAFLVGTWSALCAFNLGVVYGLFASISLNHAMHGGARAVARGVLAFVVGAGLAVAVNGWRFEPDSSDFTTYIALGLLYLYVMAAAMLFYSQHRKLDRIRRESDRKQAVFAALAAAGVAGGESPSLEQLAATTLDALVSVLSPDAGFGLLVRAPQRPGVIHHAAFRGMTGPEQDWLVDTCIERPLAALPAGLPPYGRAQYDVRVVGAVTPQAETLFLLRDAESVGALQQESIALFLQQFASALANYWLTRSLTELANTDRLTGLANRGRLDARLEELVALKDARPAADFAVVVADLNGLKHVNDTHGHAVGDRLIAATAQALERNCRDTDLVARMGGDEFVVLCQATTAPEAAVLVSRLRQAMAGLARHLAEEPGMPGLPVSMSVGWADSRECEPEQVMRLADSRMYADKQAHYRRRVESPDH